MHPGTSRIAVGWKSSGWRRACSQRLGLPCSPSPATTTSRIPFQPGSRTPWTRFEEVFDTTDPDYHSDSLVVCGLNSVRPWRHQGGSLSPARLRRVAGAFRSATPGALRVVALHHHLAGAPWRAARKFPLKHRGQVLAELAAAGAELVVGGHIHQGAVSVRREFEVLDGGATGTIVLATAPGLGRPRPHRTGEAQGALVYEWSADRLTVLTYLLTVTGFVRAARREFPRVRRV